MPNVGTVVLMKDGRVAAISAFSPTGDDDRVIFVDGHQEQTDAWQIQELLTDEDTATEVDPDPLTQLRSYIEEQESPALASGKG
jgi:hypothetical protein